MKYYNETVPFKVAKRLKDAGFPQVDTLVLYKSSGDGETGEILDKTGCIYAPCYASAIDWLIERGLSVEVFRYVRKWKSCVDLIRDGRKTQFFAPKESWHEAADCAILWALKALKK